LTELLQDREGVSYPDESEVQATFRGTAAPPEILLVPL
jgi:hypothetical protein